MCLSSGPLNSRLRGINMRINRCSSAVVLSQVSQRPPLQIPSFFIKRAKHHGGGRRKCKHPSTRTHVLEEHPVKVIPHSIRVSPTVVDPNSNTDCSSPSLFFFCFQASFFSFAVTLKNRMRARFGLQCPFTVSAQPTTSTPHTVAHARSALYPNMQPVHPCHSVSSTLRN